MNIRHLGRRSAVLHCSLYVLVLTSLVTDLYASEDEPAKYLEGQRLFFTQSERAAMSSESDEPVAKTSPAKSLADHSPVRPERRSTPVQLPFHPVRKRQRVKLKYDAYVVNGHSVQIIVNGLPCTVLQLPVPLPASVQLDLKCPHAGKLPYRISLLWPAGLLRVYDITRRARRLDVGQWL